MRYWPSPGWRLRYWPSAWARVACSSAPSNAASPAMGAAGAPKAAEAAARAIKLGPEPLLALRAHHLRSFLAGVRHFEQTGEQSEKLIQVGGGFLKRLGTNGWVEGRRVLLDRPALRAAFPVASSTAAPAATAIATADDERRYDVEVVNYAAARADALPQRSAPLSEAARPALVRQNRELQSAAAERSTRHIEIDLPEGVSYRAGDHLGVLPENPAELVEA